MLRESLNMGQLFDALRPFAVLKTFSDAIETFVNAAGRDLSSAGPSTDPELLHGLMTELGKLKRLRTTLDAVGDLVKLTDRVLPATRRGTSDVTEQTSRVLNFASLPAAGPTDARRLLGGFAAAPLAVQITFANGLRDLHGEIPDVSMPSLPARLQQSRAIMAMLDELVAAEEKAFDAAAG